MNYTIHLSEKEIKNQALHPNTLKMALHFFKTHGFLKIDNLFSKELIGNLLNSYQEKLNYNEEEVSLDNGTQASHRRHLVPIPFAAPFSDPSLYANPILLPIMKALLGPNLILSSLGAISALPGSTNQHVHADYYPLFEEDMAASTQIPTFAITLGIPLVDIDMINGPTHIWAGSHHIYPIEQNMTTYTKHYLHGNIGSCYFWDYRTFHAGGSNHSEEIRSLLYMAYTRRWFKDVLNPDYLKMSQEEYFAIPEEHRNLFIQMETQKKTMRNFSTANA
jgi:ectoine hydroxylase-related dioxygenase (phytanoyl-CoA dioxygenase family)